MKNISKKWIMAVALAFVMMVGYAFTSYTSNDWDVPEEYEKMTNPFEADDESLEIGEELYVMHCKSCHGKYGEGDGPKADNLETFCGDFTLEEFQSQSDGAIFYKSKIGRDEMPDFSKKIQDDEDIWHLVNFLREF